MSALTFSDRLNKWLGGAAILAIHSSVVYLCAIHLSPWLVYHWFGWIVPIFHLPIHIPTDWYLQHLELATITPAFVAGYADINRALPTTAKHYVDKTKLNAISVWSWVLPASVLLYEMLIYQPHSSVLYNPSTTVLAYYFDIQPIMPTRMNYLSVDTVRVLKQMTVTAPFYAGLSYSLGAFLSHRNLHLKNSGI